VLEVGRRDLDWAAGSRRGQVVVEHGWPTI
jgi:hypothetical protein